VAAGLRAAGETVTPIGIVVRDSAGQVALAGTAAWA
jgi:hypothetical protein